MSKKNTDITYGANAEFAVLTTNTCKVIDKMEKIMSKRSEMTLIEEDGDKKTFRFPRAWVKIHPNKILSAEQLEELRARGKALANRNPKKK